MSARPATARTEAAGELHWSLRAINVRHPIAAQLAGVGAAAAIATSLALGRWALAGGLLAAALLAALAVSLRRGRTSSAALATLRDGTLYSDTGLALPGAEVVAGWVVPDASEAAVEFDRRGGARVSLHVSDSATASEILEAMGFDAQRRTLRVRLGSRWDGALRATGLLLFGALQTLPLLALFAAWLHLGAPARMLLFTAMITGGFFASMRAMGPPELTIGADGITLRRGFRPRFLPYRLLRWIERDGDDLVLLLTDEQRVRITPTSRDARRDEMVVDRIRRAALQSRAAERDGALSLLDRNGRSVRDWREHIVSLHRDTAYRSAGLTAAELEAVLADPRASAARRIAAAVALAATQREPSPTRVRIAVDACADPAIQDAIESALRGEIDDEKIDLITNDARDIAELRRGLGV